jgi:hypothetical protein
MMLIGFSTGALAFGDFRLGLHYVESLGLECIELSALRENEFEPLVSALPSLGLHRFKYVSIHAPSSLKQMSEQQNVDLLRQVVDLGYPVIVHPDTITNYRLYAPLGGMLCIENMDKRKAIGRTVDELALIFERLPMASLCFDLAHARQIDPTMCAAFEILLKLRKRIRQIHISELDTQSHHRPLTLASRLAYLRVLHLVDPDVPVIIESVVPFDRAQSEVEETRHVLEGRVMSLPGIPD